MKYLKADYDQEAHRYTLTEYYVFRDTGVTGQSVSGKFWTLTPNGNLILYVGFSWDGGTFAINTKAMITASAFHDVICWLTNDGRIAHDPWRARGDKHFRVLLQQLTPNAFGWVWSWVRWTAVRTNSILHRL